jgi:predicted nucleic acid-binding protein
MSADRPAPPWVLDTNVCLDLYLFDDPRCAAVRAALDSGSRYAIASTETRAEWLRVLSSELLTHDAEQRAAADRHYLRCTQLCAPAAKPTPLPRCRDPDDQKFLILARDGGASVIYTRDRELLRLSRRTERDLGFAVLEPRADRVD